MVIGSLSSIHSSYESIFSFTFGRRSHQDDVVEEVFFVILNRRRWVYHFKRKMMPALSHAFEEYGVSLKERPVIHKDQGFNAFLLAS